MKTNLDFLPKIKILKASINQEFINHINNYIANVEIIRKEIIQKDSYWDVYDFLNHACELIQKHTCLTFGGCGSHTGYSDLVMGEFRFSFNVTYPDGDVANSAQMTTRYKKVGMDMCEHLTRFFNDVLLRVIHIEKHLDVYTRPQLKVNPPHRQVGLYQVPFQKEHHPLLSEFFGSSVESMWVMGTYFPGRRIHKGLSHYTPSLVHPFNMYDGKRSHDIKPFFIDEIGSDYIEINEPDSFIFLELLGVPAPLLTVEE